MNDGVEISNIIILSGAAGNASCINKLGAKWKEKLYHLNASNVASRPRNKLGHCKITDFKGLESMHIMVVDLEGFSYKAEQLSLLYVAITRAKAILWIAIPESKRNLFAETITKNTKRILDTINNNAKN